MLAPSGVCSSQVLECISSHLAPFQNLLTESDVEYWVACLLSQISGKPLANSGNFKCSQEERCDLEASLFNFGSESVALYFACARRKHRISSVQFAKICEVVQAMRIRRAFRAVIDRKAISSSKVTHPSMPLLRP